MSLDFMTLSAPGAVARSPMQRSAAAAGARFAERDGWEVAVAYGADPAAECRAAETAVAWADVSHLAKHELQGPAGELDALAGGALELGTAGRHGDAWWCRVAPERALVVGGPAAGVREQLSTAPASVSVLDVTTTFAALTIVGPGATEVFARFSALDLRDRATPVAGLRPGSIARQPAVLVREAAERYLFWFGAATAEYVWSVVQDAAEHLGGRPIGLDALDALDRADPRNDPTRSENA
ncbi:MAG TPA: hypothetical protein VFN55_13025 [Solirubrobacteraceae bacterium]|nr:hypothetical protein [Solirubrobacteraceae bacterium]